MGTSVLVVDDSALMRKAIKTMLVEAGDFEVHLARNGEDALEQIPRLHPDVVTLDVNMPVMDGLTCLAQIMREHPLPVVMVSSLTERGALVTLEALELGAVDYVEKPGGTVSVNMHEVAGRLVDAVSRAAGARIRSAGLAGRLRRVREGAQASASAPVERPVRRSRSALAGPHRQTDLLLVGASTGGPALVTDLLAALPADCSVPVAVAQHMPRSFTGALARRIDAVCPLGVQEVAAPVEMLGGRVYIARGDADMAIERRSGRLMARPVPAGPTYRWHPSVDRMVETAMSAVDPERILGVLLTGMGDDGAKALADLHARGGRTIAESEETAVVWGMPGQLVARGGASTVLPSDEIAAQVAAWL